MSWTVATGTGDDAGAFEAAIKSGHGLIRIPTATFRFNRGVFIPNNAVFQGEGRGFSTITAADGYNDVLLTMGFGSRLQNVTVQSRPFPSGPAIYLPPDRGEQILDNVEISGGTECVRAWSFDAAFRNCKMSGPYGRTMVWIKNSGVYLERCKLDHVGPDPSVNDYWSTNQPWQAGMNVPANYAVVIGDWVLISRNEGRTGDSPPSIPAYDGTIRDGSVFWTLLCPSFYTSVLYDSGSYSCWEWGCDHSGPFTMSVLLTDTDGKGGPQGIHVEAADWGGYWQGGVVAEAGNDLTVEDCQLGAAASAATGKGRCGVYTRGAWKGDTTVEGCTSFGNDVGILFDAGTDHVAIGNRLGGNTLSIRASNATITGNRMVSPVWGTSGVIEAGENCSVWGNV